MKDRERMKILIAYDGSECAESAIDDLKSAGLPRTAEALALTIAEELIPAPMSIGGVRTSFAEYRMEEEKRSLLLARQASERIKSLFPEWEVRPEARIGSASSEIIARADQWRPDLIVVGSHGRTALGRFVLGSVSQRVLTEANCSVRVARSLGSDAQAAARLLIGVDGSPDSEAAVTAVATRDWPLGGEARVIIAIDDVVSGVIEQIEGGRDWMHETIEAAGARLRAAGLTVSSAIKKGEPKSILPAEAEDWGANCIFVGARGLSRLERLRVGSVSAATAARAHCSVEVARPARLR